MIFRDVEKRLGDVRAGVVDKNIESREVTDFRADAGAIVYIADKGNGLAARMGDALRDFFKIFGALAEKNYFRPRRGQSDGRFSANAAACAGDERDAPVEAERGKGWRGVCAGYDLPPDRAPRPTFWPA